MDHKNSLYFETKFNIGWEFYLCAYKFYSYSIYLSPVSLFLCLYLKIVILMCTYQVLYECVCIYVYMYVYVYVLYFTKSIFILVKYNSAT